MSKLVDERVVEMSFDNRNFERNTRQTMSTLEKLKSSMNFSGAASSINSAFNSVDTSPIIASLDKAKQSFSAWEVAGITAISNITNRIVDLGIRFTKSLSTDNILSGWQKFTQVTKTSATMISQLKNTMDEELASESTSEYVQKVGWFADATSYSINDMTSAMGKFIAKGKDIDTSFKASVGIATWAASAGKNAAEAQSAFEAMSKVSDHVLMRQWYTIQALNMDTMEFKNATLEAAAAQGTLTKQYDEWTDTYTYFTKNGHEVTAENFTDYLSDGWFTMDALMDVLGDYGSAVDEVKKIQEEMDYSTPYEALDEYERRIEEEIKLAQEEIESAEAVGDAEAKAAAETKLANAQMKQFGAKTFRSASEARTLEDAINAVKDAVSSKWESIYQRIFGDSDKTTEIFSILADRLTSIFANPLQKIDDAFKTWEELNGRDDLFGTTKGDEGAIWNLITAIETFISAIKQAFAEVFPFTTSVKSITEGFKEFTKKLILTDEAAKNLKNIFKGVFSVFKLVFNLINGVFNAIKPLLNFIKNNIGKVFGVFGDLFSTIGDFISQTAIFETLGNAIAKVFSTIADTIKSLNIIERVTNFFKDFGKQLSKGDKYREIWENIKSTFSNLFGTILYLLKGIFVFIANYAIPLLLNLIKYLEIIAGAILGGVLKAINWLCDGIKSLTNTIKNNEKIQNGWAKFVSFLKSIPEKLKGVAPFFIDIGHKIAAFFKTLWAGVKEFGGKAAGIINFKAIGDIFKAIGYKIAEGCKKIIEGFKALFKSNDANKAEKKLNPLQTLLKGIIDLFKGLWNIIKALIPIIGQILSSIGHLLTYIGDSLQKTFNKSVSTGEGKGINLGALIGGGIGVLIVKGLYDFVHLFKGITSAIADTIGSMGSILQAKSAQMWAGAIKDIAISMLMMVGAILILSLMDTKKLWKAVGVLTTIMAALAAVVTIMGIFLKTTYSKYTSLFGNKFKGTKNGMKIKQMNGNIDFSQSGTGFDGVGAMILSFGLSILALVAALKIIESLDPKKVWKDLGILGILMAAQAFAIGLMNQIARIGSDTKKGMMGIKGLISFSISMLLLTVSLKKIGELPMTTIFKGLFAITTVLLAYGVATRIMNGLKPKGMAKMSVFAASMAAMVAPLTMLGDLQEDKLKRGLASILLLTAGFTTLSYVSSKAKFSNSLGLIAMMVSFTFIVKYMTELISGPIASLNEKDVWKFVGISGSLTAFIIAIGYFFKAMKKQTNIKPGSGKNTLKTVLMLVGIMTALSGLAVALVVLSKKTKDIKVADIFKLTFLISSFIALSAGIIVLSKELGKKIKNYNLMIKRLAVFGSTLLALSLISGILVIVAKGMKDVKFKDILNIVSFTAMMIALATAVICLSKELFKGKQDYPKLIKDLAIFGAVLIGLTGITAALAGIAKMISGSSWSDIGKLATLVGMVTFMSAAVLGIIAALEAMSTGYDSFTEILKYVAAFSTFMLLFTGIIALLARTASFMKDINWPDIGKLGAIGGIVVVMSGLVLGIMALLKVINPSPADFAKILAFAAITAALAGLMVSLSYLVGVAKNVNLATLGKVFLLLGGTFVTAMIGVAVAARMSSQIMKASVSLLVLSGVLASFGAAAIILGYGLESLKKNWKMLIVFIGLVAGIVVIMSLMSKMAGAVATVGAAFALFGTFIGAVALGMAVLAQAFDIFVNAIIKLLPNLDELATKAESLKIIVAALIQGFVEGVAASLPLLAEYILKTMDIILEGIFAKLGMIVEGILTFILNVLTELEKNIGEIVDKIIQIFLNIVYAFIDRMPDLMQAQIDLVIGFIDSLGQAIENNALRIRETMVGFCNHLWNAFTNFFGIDKESSGKMKEAGGSLISGVIDGITKFVSKAYKVMGKFLKGLFDAIKGGPKEFLNWGKNIMQGIWNGIKNVFTGFFSFWKNLWHKVTNWFCKLFKINSPSRLFYQYGYYTMEGYKNGLDDNKSGVEESLSDLKDTTKDTFDGAFDDAEEIYDKYGEVINQALADAIISQSTILYSAINQVIDQSLNIIHDSTDEFNEAIGAILDAIQNGIDEEDLVIRPVLDLSEVEKGTDLIASMLSSTGTIAVSTSNAEQTSNEVNAARRAARRASSPTNETNQSQAGNNDISTYNVTFNISGSDPKAIANEVSKRFQQEVNRRNAKWA